MSSKIINLNSKIKDSVPKTLPQLTKIWSNQKTRVLFFGFLFLFFSLFLPFPTLAFWEQIVNAILFLPYISIAGLLLLVISFSFVFAWLCGSILDIVISPSFISLSYTNPDHNNIIKLGLSITQSFVNLILVLVLVYTALSIALRMNETQAKKMLARLIIVALLVNFAPVFLGLIVDAANIIMYYFLNPIKGGVSGILLQISTFFDLVKSTLWGARADITNRLGVLMMAFIQIILNFATGMALFLFAGLFLFRYIAIWTLVIIAPIAFVAWIFPSGKIRGFFDMWFNNFIQWSIIGIPIAFFLYLSVGSFSLMSGAFKTKLEMPGMEPMASGFFDQLFPYFVILAFLFYGFIFGLSTGAIGASAAISLTQKTGRTAGQKMAEITRRGGSQVLSRITRGREEAIRKWSEKQTVLRMSDVFGTSKAGKAIATTAGLATGVTPAVWALRRGLGHAFLKLKEIEEKEVKDAEGKYEKTNVERKAAAITNRLLPATERIGALRKAVDEGQIVDLKEFFQRSGLSIKQINDQITSLMREALRIHPDVFKKLRDAFPHLAEEAGKNFEETIQKEAGVHLQQALTQGYPNVTARIMDRMKAANIPLMDASSLFGPNMVPEVREAAIKYWDGSQWAEAGRSFGKAFTASIKDEFLARKQDFTPSAQRYFTASPAGKALYGIHQP